MLNLFCCYSNMRSRVTLIVVSFSHNTITRNIFPTFSTKSYPKIIKPQITILYDSHTSRSTKKVISVLHLLLVESKSNKSTKTTPTPIHKLKHDNQRTINQYEIKIWVFMSPYHCVALYFFHCPFKECYNNVY